MAAEHEARAQKALTDSLTDALAMLRHGSARSKEHAALQIANTAIETTISQPFHPVTFRNACVRAGIVGELVKVLDARWSDFTRRRGGSRSCVVGSLTRRLMEAFKALEYSSN